MFGSFFGSRSKPEEADVYVYDCIGCSGVRIRNLYLWEKKPIAVCMKKRSDLKSPS